MVRSALITAALITSSLFATSAQAQMAGESDDTLLLAQAAPKASSSNDSGLLIVDGSSSIDGEFGKGWATKRTTMKRNYDVVVAKLAQNNGEALAIPRKNAEKVLASNLRQRLGSDDPAQDREDRKRKLACPKIRVR